MPTVEIERIADAVGLRPQTRAVMFGTGFQVTSVPDGVLVGPPEAAGAVTGYERVDATATAIVTTAAVQAAIAGQAIAPSSVTTTGDVTIGGKLTLGPDTFAAGSASTTGGAPVVVLQFLLADNSSALVDVRVVGRAPSPARHAAYAATVAMVVDAGSFSTPTAPALISVMSEFGIPLNTGVPTWAAGVVSITVGGPSATVIGSEDDGSGKLQLIFAGGITSAIDTVTVTVAGLSGTPGGNGAHVATFVSATKFKLSAVAYVAPDASGTVTLASTVVAWSASAHVVVTPAP